MVTNFIDDIVDKSVAQSFKKTSASRDDQREKSKLVDMTVNGKMNMNALSETPIKILPNISNGNTVLMIIADDYKGINTTN